MTWIQFAALLFVSHVSSGTSPSQKLFICDGRKYLTPSEVGTRINVICYFVKVTKVIQLPLQGAFNPKISNFMGTGSSALLAHLAGIYISGQETEALLRGHRLAARQRGSSQRAGGSQE